MVKLNLLSLEIFNLINLIGFLFLLLSQLKDAVFRKFNKKIIKKPKKNDKKESEKIYDTKSKRIKTLKSNYNKRVYTFNF